MADFSNWASVNATTRFVEYSSKEWTKYLFEDSSSETSVGQINKDINEAYTLE